MKITSVVIIVVALLMFAVPGRADLPLVIDPTSTTGVDPNYVEKLKTLALGVGWDVEPTDLTTARLKQVGFKSIRLINVEPAMGGDAHFEPDGTYVVDKAAPRFVEGLQECRVLGAIPHICICQYPPPQLCTKVYVAPASGVLGNQTTRGSFGPNDWTKYRNYLKGVYKYVIIDQGFTNARFEIGNEPEISPIFTPSPPKPAMGSIEGYNAYLKVYRTASEAAVSFEKEHPGIHVTVGGPASAWEFTFVAGTCHNWPRRFIEDCSREKLRLDFIGLHWYGNGGSLDGEFPSNYPSFMKMFRDTKAARDQYCPGVPIWFTEWGASYHTNNDPNSVINGNNIGAAFGINFLDRMLTAGVEGALYLGTTDYKTQGKDGKWQDVWGWPCLFTNPGPFGKSYPKAPFHVFDMISRLEGQRVEGTGGETNIRCIASADPEKKRITAIVWNYNCVIPEFALPTDRTVQVSQSVHIGNADAFFGSHAVHMKRWLVSKDLSNAYGLFVKEGKVDDRCKLQQVDDSEIPITNKESDFGITMPPSSVAFITLEAHD